MSRKTRRRAAATMESANSKVMEAITSLVNTYVDPDEAFVDPQTGERWNPLGVGGGEAWERYGTPQDDSQLQQVRQQCRYLALTDPFALCGHENRISYIVGSGHTYSIQWKPGEEPTQEATEADGEDQTLADCQTAIDDFVEENRWHQRQQEIVRRKDRDGECFLRLFTEGDKVKVRFVEPSQVATPANNSTDTFGIKTDPADVETVLGYWIDGQLVDAMEVQHRKANVDANVKRGLPLFWPVRLHFRDAQKTLKNMGATIGIQAAIAMIRKTVGASKSGVEAFVKGNADVSVTNDSTGLTSYHKRYGPGTIIDGSSNTEYEFPASGADVSKWVAAIQASLRAIASRLVMPEFMLSSDASNANYSSTMVAEGPAVKMFERCQWDMIVDDTAILKRVLAAAGFADDLLTKIVITATPPRVQTRDRLKDAQADFILNKAGALSAETMMERADLDPEVEKERLAAEREEAAARAPVIPPGQPPGLVGQGQDDEAGVPFRRDDALVPGSTTESQEEDGNWVTLDNGEHVFIDKGGSITKGPRGLVGKPAGSKISGMEPRFWTRKDIIKALDEKREVPAEAWAANYEYAVKRGYRDVANEVLLRYEKQNPSVSDAVAELQKYAKSVGVNLGGKSYKSQGGTHYLTVKYADDFMKTIRVGGHGGSPQDVNLTTIQHPEDFKDNLDKAKKLIKAAGNTTESRTARAASILWENYP